MQDLEYDVDFVKPTHLCDLIGESNDYTKIYYHLFKNSNTDVMRILEINSIANTVNGLLNYFNNSDIFCISSNDININDKRFSYFKNDEIEQNKIIGILNIVNFFQKFNIIICKLNKKEEQITTFENSCWKLEKNSYYFIENVEDEMQDVIYEWKMMYLQFEFKLIHKLLIIYNKNDNTSLMQFHGNHNTTYATQTQKIYINLIRWLRDNGGYVNDKIYIDEKDRNRYLYIKDNIIINEQICSIPHKCCISTDLYNLIPNITCKINKESTEQYKLLFTLLYHIVLGTTSSHHAYILSLPKYEDFEYHPLYKYNNLLKEGWEKISPELIKILDNYEIEIDKITKLFQNQIIIETKYINYQNIKYCYLIILTRQIEDKLMPLYDLMQHNNKTTNIISIIDNKYNMTATNLMTKLSNIFISYGNLDDFAMLYKYGFVDNPEYDNNIRYYPLTITINNENTVLNTLIINEINKVKNIYGNMILTNKCIKNNIFVILRIMSLSEKDIKIIDLNTKYYENVITLDNELTVYKTFLALLKKISSSINKDELDFAVYTSKYAEKNTFEYQLAKALIFKAKVINYNIKFTMLNWNKLLKPNVNYEVKYDEYDKIFNKYDNE